MIFLLEFESPDELLREPLSPPIKAGFVTTAEVYPVVEDITVAEVITLDMVDPLASVKRTVDVRRTVDCSTTGVEVVISVGIDVSLVVGAVVC